MDCVVRGTESSKGLLKVILVGVALEGGVVALVLVCKGLGAALCWDLIPGSQL
jgi:hypothetical protein